MRIECPGCDAAYEVPEAQIRPGRSVRCVRCAVQWRPGGELPEAVMAASLVEPPGEVPFVHDEPAAHDELPVHDEPVRDGVVRLRQSGVPAPLAAAGETVAQGTGTVVRKLATWRMGWMASLILLGGLRASATYWRMAIFFNDPATTEIYTMLGAEPPQT